MTLASGGILNIYKNLGDDFSDDMVKMVTDLGRNTDSVINQHLHSYCRFSIHKRILKNNASVSTKKTSGIIVLNIENNKNDF